jgi:hypothetical protein
MTHQFMYPKVNPVRDTEPTTDSDGSAGPAGPHNDTAGGPPSRVHTEPGSGPPVVPGAPLPSAPTDAMPSK